MKNYTVKYAFIEQNGTVHEWNPEKRGFDGYKDNFTYHVEAADIEEALAKAKEQICAMGYNRNWRRWTITDVGICDDDIW